MTYWYFESVNRRLQYVLCSVESVDCSAPPASTKFSEDFIKKMEEWEQKKLGKSLREIRGMGNAFNGRILKQYDS